MIDSEALIGSPLLRLLVALGALAGGGLSVALGAAWGGVLAVIGLWLLWRYARDGGVGAAFGAFKHGDLDRVRGALRHALWPGLLAPRKRAYYHWMRGVVLATECRFDAAREQLLRAAAGEIQTENDRSLIHCLLAEVALQLGEWPAAHEHLRLAGNLDHHERIDGMIAALERRLSERVAASPRDGGPDIRSETQAKTR